MAKSVNDLSKKDYKTVEGKLQTYLSQVGKSLITLAEIYDIDKNELFSWWLFMSEEYASRDLSAKKGISVDEGMQMLKRLFELSKRAGEGGGVIE